MSIVALFDTVAKKIFRYSDFTRPSFMIFLLLFIWLKLLLIRFIRIERIERSVKKYLVSWKI